MAVDFRTPVALTIAGSDSSAGAGIQADLKTFAAFGVYGASVITALTAQNTCGVQGISVVDSAFVVRQLDSVFGDLRVVAAKTGMLATAPIVAAVSDRLAAVSDLQLVVDPVMVATSGDQLLSDDAIDIYVAKLLPRACLVTPNLPEAARLLRSPEATTIDVAVAQAKALLALGCRAVLLKGGHGAGSEVVDVFCTPEGVDLFAHPRIATRNTHGTGCTLSAAVTAALVEGASLRDAVAVAVNYVSKALESSKDLTLGSGHGPVDHQFALRRSNG
jgi:hydroxymethylpyrimidine/phosphomethylpyrimidine kinase